MAAKGEGGNRLAPKPSSFEHTSIHAFCVSFTGTTALGYLAISFDKSCAKLRADEALAAIFGASPAFSGLCAL